MKWQGKTALITGGVSGIGFGIARAFSAAGIDLILTYRNNDYRQRAEAWFKQHARAVPRFVSLDVTDRRRWAEIAVEVGPVHILVNNAGVSVFGPTDEASFADYDWIMGVNFGGVVNGLVTFIPGMKAQGSGGHIVNVASMAAYLPGPQAGIYTASKFAVRGLTESLRFNLAPHGIGVSLMCPGLTKTNAWDSALRRPADFAASGFAPPDLGCARAIWHRVRCRHGSSRSGRKDPGRHDREPRDHFHPSGIRGGLRGNPPRLCRGAAPGANPRSTSAHRAAAPRGQSRCGSRQGNRLGRPDLSELNPPAQRIRTCRWNWRPSPEPAAPRPNAPSPCSPRHAECRPPRCRDRPH